MEAIKLEVGRVYLLNEILNFMQMHHRENLFIRTSKNYDFFQLQSTNIKFKVNKIENEFNHKFNNEGSSIICNTEYTIYFIEEVK